MIRVRRIPVIASLGVCIFSAACNTGPNYRRPTAPIPAQWEVVEPWRESSPKDGLPKGQWWAIFRDDVLNALEKQALDANFTLKIAAAHLEQARASAAIQIATQFPSLTVSPSVQRQRLSGNRPANSNFPVRSAVSQTNIVLPFSVGYEVDLFARRLHNIEAAQAAFQASAADLENVRLVIAAETAGDYFTVRQLDSELGILDRTVETLQRGLALVNSRHQGGLSSGLDVAQEETLLHATQTQAILLRQQRKQFEDAIAVLVGQPAPHFHLATSEGTNSLPDITLGLPSDLLERRPDIAESERQMAITNAQVGIAAAAYFPSLNLFGEGGWQAADIAKLLNVQSTFWALGANVSEAIFSGGTRRAQKQFARAGFDASVAAYREAVLNAVREVQDSISGLTILEQAEQSEEKTVAAARRALEIATSRYAGGLVNYLDVVNAQQNLLNNQQELAFIHGQRLVTSVLLVKALGGGWDASSLASAQVKPKLKDSLVP
jgi:outer membrane protein, multidrug efflux system